MRYLFPLLITLPPPVKVALTATMLLPINDAEKFYQVFSKTDTRALIRPEVVARTNGNIMRVAIANDADNYLMVYENGEFITVAEKKRREEEVVRKRVEEAERQRLAIEREREREHKEAESREALKPCPPLPMKTSQNIVLTLYNL